MLGSKFGKYKENNKFSFTLPNFDHKRKYYSKKRPRKNQTNTHIYRLSTHPYGKILDANII